MNSRSVLSRVREYWSARVCHFVRLNEAVEFPRRDEAEPQRLFLQRRSTRMSRFRHLRRIVVADFRRKRGDQHQRALHEFLDAFFVSAYSFDAMLGEGARGVCQ